MIKNTQSLILFLLVVLFQACQNNQPAAFEEKPVVIAGKITNYNPAEHPQTISVIRRDFFEIEKKMVAEIDTLGNFKIKYPTYIFQEVYLKYGSFITLAIEPGDSLYLELDSKLLKDDNIDFVDFVHDPHAETNKLLNKLTSVIGESSYFKEAQEVMKKMSPSEFMAFEIAKKEAYSKIITEFKEKNSAPAAFNMIAEDFLKYHIWEDILRYRWYHPYLNDISEDSLHLPDDFFSSLSNYDMNDHQYFSFPHMGFMHELSMYVAEQPKDSLLRARELYAKGKEVESVLLMNSLTEMHSSGLTFEIFYSTYNYQILKGHMLSLFEEIYDSTKITEPVLKKIINQEHKKLIAFLNNKDTGNANLSSIKSTEVAEFMSELVASYKNKVIYIDFWAPWCSPCMAEMPHSTELQKYFESKDVVFLFLANRCTEESWKSTIANFKFTGEHVLLSDKQFEILSGYFNFNGIPHYALIDKNGRIVMKDAPRPSNQEKTIKTIENYLAIE